MKGITKKMENYLVPVWFKNIPNKWPTIYLNTSVHLLYYYISIAFKHERKSKYLFPYQNMILLYTYIDIRTLRYKLFSFYEWNIYIVLISLNEGKRLRMVPLGHVIFCYVKVVHSHICSINTLSNPNSMLISLTIFRV